ncbi:hypothetical protein [Mycolicibacterium sp.]|uniref:hypothetical protein n=1 Tax=Mycolicibacterium sp. TaxID=2320850 RepID=UPI001A1B1855|nr:hypothetical protein [Mycolicibacterium sp.]MBJ7337094.1 hypothetical protein [Mycolicibacterium sp.]
MDGEARDGDGPVPLDALADLQAGLLDDATAARLRRRARTEPDVARRLAALDRVRRSVADLGADVASAPDIPAEVTARIGATLRAAPPAGAIPPTRTPSPCPRRIAAAVGVAAILAAAAVGTVALIRDGSREQSGASDGLPLSDEQIVDLLSQPPDLGVLADPQRRVSCLSGLGYPTSTSVLGARPVDVNGTSEVLILLPGDTPRRLNAVVVAPSCSSIDTGLRASRVVDHP